MEINFTVKIDQDCEAKPSNVPIYKFKHTIEEIVMILEDKLDECEQIDLIREAIKRQLNIDASRQE